MPHEYAHNKIYIIDIFHFVRFTLRFVEFVFEILYDITRLICTKTIFLFVFLIFLVDSKYI